MTPSAAPRVIAIGETMMLVTPATAEPLATATDFRLDAGGAESNVASHLAQLGIPSAWISALGDDALGDRLDRVLRARGVDTQWVVRDPHAPTGVYFKDPGRGVLYYRSGSAASHMGPGTLSRLPLDQAETLHLSGITPALSPSCDQLVDAAFRRAADTETLISFDVNFRSALWTAAHAADTLRRYAQRADLVFVGLDEAHTLWGCETPGDVRSFLPKPRLIVKDGDHGATEFDGDRATFVPAIPTQVVEVVGAGDAFAAGYIASLLTGGDTTDRLWAGHERAHLVLQSTSDFVTSSIPVVPHD